MNLRRASLVLAAVAVAMVAVMVYLTRPATREARQPRPGERPPIDWIREPAPRGPHRVFLSAEFRMDELDLREVGLLRQGDPTLVGVAGAVKVEVTTKDVNLRSRGALHQIVEVQAAAQKRALIWLAERQALEIEASRLGMPLVEALMAGYHSLPQPSDAELAELRSNELPPDAEARAAARAQWRMLRWRAKRSLIVKAGLGDLSVVVTSRPESRPTVYSPEVDEVARIGNFGVTRADLRLLAGLSEQSARSEYFDELRRRFDEIAEASAVESEAVRQGTTVDALYAKAEREFPPVSANQIADYIRKEPGYLKLKDGRKVVRTNLELARHYHARVDLAQRLAKSVAREFLVPEPGLEPTAFQAVEPIVLGAKSARVVVVALHAFGSQSGRELAAALEQLVAEYGDRVRFELLPHYPDAEAIIPYRATLALHCAQEQGRVLDYFRDLRRAFPYASLDNLTGKAKALGLDAARFRQCLEEDRYLPFIAENRLVAERVGLGDGDPAVFVNGLFVKRFRERGNAEAAIDRALGIPAPTPGAQPLAAATAARDGGAAARAADAGAVTARVSRDGGVTGAGPGDLASDPVKADLQALMAKSEADMKAVGDLLRKYPQGSAVRNPEEAGAALATYAAVARRAEGSFASYKALTPEVKALVGEAAAAWKDYADAVDRVIALGKARNPQDEKAKTTLEAMNSRWKRVSAAMNRIMRAASEKGL